MNRDEILKRVQSEKKNFDERDEAINNRSFYWTYLSTTLISAVILITKLIRNESSNDIMAILFFSVSSGLGYRFSKTRHKIDLMAFIIDIAVAVMYTVKFFMEG